MYRLLTLTLTLAGCAELGLACTEMGCSGTLSVALSRALAEDAVVTVEADGEVYDCPPTDVGEYSPSGCQVVTDDAGLPVISIRTGSVAWPEIVVSVSEAGADPVDHVVTPEWGERIYPNGKACDGEDGGCIGGAAELTLDGSGP